MSGKISEQPTLLAPADGDLLPVVEVAEPKTLKTITWANLVAAIKTALSWDSIANTLASVSSAIASLGGAASLDVGTSSGTVCAGDDSRLSNSRKCNNTFDSAAAARTNLELGSAALLNAGASANNLLQLNASAQIPAVSGALLTGITASQISGLSSGMPVGAVIAVASTAVPTGFLECNGAAVSRTTYASLFSQIGVTHGYGDNSTTFNIPDYRGFFLRGWSHGVASRDPDKASRTAMATGGSTGDLPGTTQQDAFESHTHTLQIGVGTSGSTSTTTGPTSAAMSVSSLPNTGGNETRPINAYVMYCIKY